MPLERTFGYSRAVVVGERIFVSGTAPVMPDGADPPSDAYSQARDQMLTRTHCPESPWTIVRGDKKARARLSIIRDIVARLAPDQAGKAGKADPDVLRPFDAAALTDGFLSR